MIFFVQMEVTKRIVRSSVRKNPPSSFVPRGMPMEHQSALKKVKFAMEKGKIKKKKITVLLKKV